MPTTEVIRKTLALAQSQQRNWKRVGVTESWSVTPNGQPCPRCSLPVFRGVYGYAGDVCKCDFQVGHTFREAELEALKIENERLKSELYKLQGKDDVWD